jgi:hypothetical protein
LTAGILPDHTIGQIKDLKFLSKKNWGKAKKFFSLETISKPL